MMIQTFNNIIFFIGYICLFLFMIVLIIGFIQYIHEYFMNNCKRYFYFIFNKALDKRLKEITKEDLIKWQKSQMEKFEKYKNKD